MYKFEEKISNFEVCLTTDYNDWHILPTELIDDIASGIHDGKWYTVLGPPRCQKSFLLKSISSKLQNDKPFVIIDLKELRSHQHADLLRKFCILIRDHLNKLNLSTCTCFDGKIRDVNQVVIKLKECLSIIKQDLVLFIDHIEMIKIRPLMLLFDVFENIYRTQKENDPYKLTLVIASSFIVPSMAQKQPPIPEFAEVILIQDLFQDLYPGANKILIDCFAEINSVEIEDDARKLCIDYASDDREVIYKLLKHAYIHSEDYNPIEKLPIRERDVQKAIDWFIKDESKSYVPLRKTIRAIENSPPEIMLYVLVLIKDGSFSLEHPGDSTVPQTTVEGLVLTGAVQRKIKGNRCEYIIRNEIYQRCLKNYFHCDRVVDIFITSGNWDIAIKYLEDVPKDTPAVNLKLLETIVSSIYVAKAEERAYKLLLKALTNVFKISKVRIYIINTAQTNFTMVSPKGAENYPVNLSVEEQSTPEIQAYLCKDYIVDIPKDKNKDEVLIMPLLKDEDNVFGLVAMHNFKYYHLSDEFQDLLSFIKRSGEAIGTVIERQRAINRIDKQAKRLETLQGISSSLVSKLDPKEILDSIGQHICELLEADSSLFLIVEKQKGLITQKCGHNYDDEFLNQLEFDELMEGMSGEVLETGKPCIHENAQALSKGKALKHAKEHNTGPIIVTPLLAKTHIMETDSLSKFYSRYDIQEKEIKQKVIGTLTACRKIGTPSFTNEDYDLACMLALQAAVAIENAKLHKKAEEQSRIIPESLAKVAGAVVGTFKMKELLDQIVHTTKTTLNAEMCSIYIEDKYNKPDYLSCVAGAGFAKNLVGIAEYKIGKGFTGMIAKTGKEFNITSKDIENLKINNLWTEKFDYLQYDEGKNEFKNMIALPLKIKDEILGVIKVENKIDENFFSVDDLTVSKTIANVIALAIQNTKLHEKTESQLKTISSALSEVADAVVGNFKMDKLLDQIINTTMRTLNAEVCSIFLENREKKPGYIKCVAGSGFAKKIVGKAEYKIGEALTGTVAKEGIPFNIKNQDEIQELEKKGKWKGKHDNIQWPSGESEFRNLLALPLKIKDQILGVIKVENKINGHFFTDDDSIVFKTIANVIALTIEKTRLQLQIENQLKKISAMAGHRINNLVTRYDGINRKLRRLMKNSPIDSESLFNIEEELQEATTHIKRMMKEFSNYGSKIELKKEYANITQIIKDEIWLAKPSDKIKIHFEPSEQIRVDVDTARFSESIRELLNNAKRIIQEYQGAGNIYISTSYIYNDIGEKTGVSICLKDDGPGFQPGFPVFEPFESTDPKGTGLGLATVKQNIEAHDGFIKTYEEKNFGACFEINLYDSGE